MTKKTRNSNNVLTLIMALIITLPAIIIEAPKHLLAIGLANTSFYYSFYDKINAQLLSTLMLTMWIPFLLWIIFKAGMLSKGHVWTYLKAMVLNLLFASYFFSYERIVGSDGFIGIFGAAILFGGGAILLFLLIGTHFMNKK